MLQTQIDNRKNVHGSQLPCWKGGNTPTDLYVHDNLSWEKVYDALFSLINPPITNISLGTSANY